MTANGKIWNLDQVTFDLISAARRGKVSIDLAFEGPCCQDIGLDQLLDKICNFLSLDPNHFEIYTSNQLPSSKYREKRNGFVELEHAKKFCNTVRQSSLEKRFGMFIGRSNASRLGIASHLYQQHKKQTEMSFHYDPADDYHRSNFGLELFLEKNWDHRHKVFEFLDHVPITYDAQTYPILWNQKAFDLDSQYQKLFCEIVCETYTSGKTFFVTEKTMRCIAFKRPFVVHGPKYFLYNLKLLGFQTFDAWWDELYDSDSDDARYGGLLNNIDWIGSQSHDTIKQWYDEMKPVLEHNCRVLKNLTNQQILKTTFHYD